MAKSKVNNLGSTVHTPRTIVHLTVNDPPVVGAIVLPGVTPPTEEILVLIAEIRQANPRSQPVRYETLQRWADELERYFAPLPPL